MFCVLCFVSGGAGGGRGRGRGARASARRAGARARRASAVARAGALARASLPPDSSSATGRSPPRGPRSTIADSLIRLRGEEGDEDEIDAGMSKFNSLPVYAYLPPAWVTAPWSSKRPTTARSASQPRSGAARRRRLGGHSHTLLTHGRGVGARECSLSVRTTHTRPRTLHSTATPSRARMRSCGPTSRARRSKVSP